MFERFTERARQVVVLSQEEARALRHGHIGTEHLLLGLLREEEGLAARVLESLGVMVEGAREQVIQVVGVGPDDGLSPGQLPMTPRAKKVLEHSLREALSLGHNYIGTEHILLGLVREGDGVGLRILRDLVPAGAEPDATIRNEVIRMLSGPGAHRKPRTPDPRRSVVEETVARATGSAKLLTSDSVSTQVKLDHVANALEQVAKLLRPR